MEFSEAYFQSEIRDGFTISSLMKRCWAAQLEVLEQFDDMCNRHGIRYWLGEGSLLGAVRHKGFIPWDDDIDIWMVRQDLNRLQKEAIADIAAAGFELVTPFSDATYNNLNYRLINTRQIRLEEDFLIKYHLFPFSAGLDIFPLDYLPEDKEKRSTMKTLAVCANVLGQQWQDKSISIRDKLETYYQLTEMLAVPRVSQDEIENELWRLTDRISAMYGPEDGDHVACMTDFVSDESKCYPAEWFEHTLLMDFEETQFPVIEEYDRALQIKYGEDYMIPKKIPGDHEYPYYRKYHRQLMDFFEANGINCPSIYMNL